MDGEQEGNCKPNSDQRRALDPFHVSISVRPDQAHSERDGDGDGDGMAMLIRSRRASRQADEDEDEDEDGIRWPSSLVGRDHPSHSSRGRETGGGGKEDISISVRGSVMNHVISANGLFRSAPTAHRSCGEINERYDISIEAWALRYRSFYRTY